jgi:bla regulator protein blaR1
MIVLTIVEPASWWWRAVGAAFVNHVWQSTLFAAMAGLLTVVLRKNRAHTRYWLWLAASVKFLIPFSLLVGIGSHLGWLRVPATGQSDFSIVLEEITQPFAPVNAGYALAPAASNALAAAVHLLPALLLVVWFSGCMAVLLSWRSRWRRMAAVLRGAAPVKSGREVESLRRLEQEQRIARHLEVVVSKSSFEPGIVGVFHPVILLPAGISDRLTDAQMEAIITHELCHVRRRDNLASVIHMVVEAAFWFHPLVWWIGARLVDERERACDEEVLRLGNDPQIYAESILRICEFYLESPLVCAAGVTGSDLKKRIEEIMTQRGARKLELAKKLLLAAMGAAAVMGPIVFGLFHATPGQAQSQTQDTAGSTPGFEAALIKPNKTGIPMPPFKIISNPVGTGFAFRNNAEGFAATNVTLHTLIHQLYGLQDYQVSGGPAWINSERYDVEVKFKPSDVNDPRKLMDQRRPQLEALLTNRFKLALHRETRDLPGYELVLLKDGPKFKESKTGYADSNGVVRSRLLAAGDPENGLTAQAVQMGSLAQELSRRLGRPVLDKTGLAGNYDFTLRWASDGSQSASTGSMLTALSEQLGLQLNARTIAVEMLVVDHAEAVTSEQ